MWEIQKTRRMYSLCGKNDHNIIEKIKSFFVVRKHLEPQHKEYERVARKCNSKNTFCFVSSPKIIDQQNSVLSKVNLWCHPFRHPDKMLRRSSITPIMLPESDFMDSSFVNKSKNNNIKYDFFYFCVNDRTGVLYKGFHTFIDTLPALCGDMKLKCVMIVYYPSQGNRRNFSFLSKDRKKILRKYQDSVKILWGWQDQIELSEIMSQCKFGYFPNEVDCSPRIIPECILRDRPVLVNKNIWGGWHYINEYTGRLFNPKSRDSLVSAVEEILSNKSFLPMENFMSYYGLVKSSHRLSNALSNVFPQIKQYSHIYFLPYRHYMAKLLNAKVDGFIYKEDKFDD